MEIPNSLIAALRAARHVVALTGAGISAESGVPTFRDSHTGLWSRFKPEELATPAAFARDAPLVWGWYEWRRSQLQRVQPNPGHRAIAELEKRLPRLTLITQNVDDLHERAGSTRVHHLHGEIGLARCGSCGEPHPRSSGPLSAVLEPRRIDPPRCHHCGERVRPGVVWFGEQLPQREWELAARAAADCEVFLCIGTSSLVYPAASLTELAIEAGALTVQINTDSTHLDARVSVDLRAPAGRAVPAIVTALRE